MHHTLDPLTERDRRFLSSKLLEYSNDDGVLDFSELDGLLTALVSSPTLIPLSVWYPALWGGESMQPDWQSEEELEQFLDLALQHLSHIATVLMEQEEEFAPHFNSLTTASDTTEDKILSAEEWCFGYMRGVTLAGGWTELPAQLQDALDCIRLHGTEEFLDALEAMTPQEQQASITRIAPAVRALHSFWLSQHELHQAH